MDDGKFTVNHFFDGFAMVSKFHIRNGKVSEDLMWKCMCGNWCSADLHACCESTFGDGPSTVNGISQMQIPLCARIHTGFLPAEDHGY